MSERGRAAAILGCAAASVGFHLYLVFSGLMPSLAARPLHLALGLPFVFLLRPAGRLGRWTGWGFGLAGLAGCAYIVLNRDALVDQYGSLQGPVQYLVAVVLIVVVLEMARRAVQPVLPAVAALVLLYGLFGQALPASIGHAGTPLGSFLGTLVIAEGGLWGQLTGISVDLIVPFLILGAFVSAGEAGAGFMSFATQLAGRFRAGAAKVSVLASAFYGTITGSASANVASTGTITIPAMQRLGYPGSLAAAVEAVASTGGQIMPPVMGAGVFLMAELLRMRYADLMVAASLPALLFFTTAWFGVHHFALRHALAGLRPEEMPGWRLVGRTMPFFLVPFTILVLLLAAGDYSAAYAAAIATGVTAVLLAANSDGQVSLVLWWRRVRGAIVDAAQQAAMIAAIIVCAGLIVGVFNITGLGVKITSLIVSLSGGNLWVALMLTGGACLVLGMELPTTAAYLICIAVAGPALTRLGLPELHAHLFVFWYALLCTITPPVCGNVFIAASIAKTPWLPVAGAALRIGIGLFVIPLGFVANPALLHLADAPVAAVAALLKLGLGTALLSYGAIGGGEGTGLWRAAAVVISGLVIFAFGIG